MNILEIVATIASVVAIVKFRAYSDQPLSKLGTLLGADKIKESYLRKVVDATIRGFLLTLVLSLIWLFCLSPLNPLSTLFLLGLAISSSYDFE